MSLGTDYTLKHLIIFRPDLFRTPEQFLCNIEGLTVSSNHSEKINIYKPKGIFVKSQSLTFNLFKSAFNAQAK